MAKDIVFYDYWRSSASYRVRIALNLLGVQAEYRPVNLLTRAHLEKDYLALNPQGLLPALVIDGKTLTQSLAIIEYLHATTPGSQLLPEDIDGQYKVRQLSYAIAMEIHPVCNLSIVSHVAEITGGGDEARKAWMQHFISRGLAAFENLLDGTGPFCHGDKPTMADCCLVPQIYNANRWGVDISAMPKIHRAMEACQALDAFKDAHPDVIGAPADK